MPDFLLDPANLPDTIPEAFRALTTVAADRMVMQIKEGEGYRRHTYSELLEQVRGLSRSLFELGLRPGDRIAIVAENRPEWIIAYLRPVGRDHFLQRRGSLEQSPLLVS